MKNLFKNFFKDERNIILSACLVLAIIIIITIVMLIRTNSPKIRKEAIENDLTKMAQDFYENFYYDSITSDLGTSQISKFEDYGIIIDLNILSRYKQEYSDKINSFKHPKTNQECDREKTKAIIYPKDPYSKTDYDIKIELDCGFED